MKMTLKTITPAIAEKWLAKNTSNRPPTEQRINALVRDIKLGKWKLNGATIVLNCDRLIDGQHRLMAVVKSGIAIESMVVEGVASDVFDTIDTGKNRSAADTLAVKGEAYSKTLAAALRIIDRYMTGRMNITPKYANWEIEKLYEQHPTLSQSVKHCYNGPRIIQRGILSACHYLFTAKDPDLANKLVEAIVKGKNLSEGDPFYLLRERLMQNSIAKAKLNEYYITALVIKAWNAKRHGRELFVLKFSQGGEKNENFPVIE